jgi:hypothetical protein
MMIALQNSSVDLLMYYDASIESSYGGMFNPLTREPFKAYYPFLAFNALFKLGDQYPLTVTTDEGQPSSQVFALAAGNDEGKRALLLVNASALTGRTEAVTLTLPEGKWRVSLLDDAHDLSPVDVTDGTVTLGADALVLMESL